MKDQCYRILSDGNWHGCNDFLHLGLSYRNRINELKKEGESSGRFFIESQRDGKRTTYKYRLVRIFRYSERTTWEKAKEITKNQLKFDKRIEQPQLFTPQSTPPLPEKTGSEYYH